MHSNMHHHSLIHRECDSHNRPRNHHHHRYRWRSKPHHKSLTHRERRGPPRLFHIRGGSIPGPDPSWSIRDLYDTLTAANGYTGTIHFTTSASSPSGLT